MSLINKQFDNDIANEPNRKKFLRRNEKAIKEALKHAINAKSITDIDKHGTDITIRGHDLTEPSFSLEEGTGRKEVIHDGNVTNKRGDTWPKPNAGSDDEGASEEGDYTEEFSFHLTKEEFIQFFLDDLTLPNLIKKSLEGVVDEKYVRAGYTKDGIRSNFDIKKTFLNALGRRISTKESLRKQIAEETDEEKVKQLIEKFENVPYLDDIDIRYRNLVLRTTPIEKAVMFCLIDASGSMGPMEKDLAKRFFILLYLFLTNHYSEVKLIFIRHTVFAQEVEEEDFFYSKESGGTHISSGYRLINSIQKERFDLSEWNIYVAQASDGDNFPEDSRNMVQELEELLPKCQYFAYVEVHGKPKSGPTELWRQMLPFTDSYSYLQMKILAEISEIYDVFRGLFK